ncbi:DUF4221 family protein [Litoribacter ruber]|uniref:DUF4221 family protein n=1 Tax=Litoribacter ruber TaxID=702568 RepID=A0AAP2CF06_9BACT|nr:MULTISPECIES: DUF4221 family protein [Litoribacter]MBS9523351.1 DUF4221 family protein [Litoribacter alkaliphilus]MBT0812523.1 DUF4221 family protein [Litoribacter ruber]
MKRFLLPLSLMFGIACSDKGSEEGAQQLTLTFEVDTVMVDAGEDFIYLRSGLYRAELSSDGRALYNFNDNENLLEVIDMDNLRLSHKIPFEKEGPHGTGQVYRFQDLTNGNYLISNFTSIGIFTDKAHRKEYHKFSTLSEEVMEKGEIVSPEGILLKNGKTYVTFYAKGWAVTDGIVKFDLESNEAIKLPVDQLTALDRFTVKVHDKTQTEINWVGKYLSSYGEKVLISNSVDNQLLIYDPEENSIIQHDFQAKLTANTPKEFARREVDTQDELMEIGNSFRNDIFFSQWIFDSTAERFYRLTYLLDKEVDGQKEFKTVLTILDKEFQQVYEGVTPLKKKYFKPFVREGKLYLYENINDELGFIVLSITEV